MGLRPALLLVCLVWLLAPAGIQAQQQEEGARPLHASPYEPLADIRFVGNRTTRPRILLQEMFVGVGDPADPALIERSRQAIMDLGLFRTVQADVIQSDRGPVLYVSVTEKYYIFPLPSLGRSGDGDISYGADIDIQNLGGRNQRLKVGFERETLRDSRVDEKRTVSLDFEYPRMFGSPWAFEFGYDLRRTFRDEVRGDRFGEFEEDFHRVTIGASRWLRTTGPSKGWRVRTRVQATDYNFEFLDGDPTLFFDATEVEFSGGIEFLDIQEFEFNRAGIHYGYNLGISDDALGSDANYIRHGLFLRRYLPVSRRPHTNLNMQFRFSHSTNTLFGDSAFELGGSTSLRGYRRETFGGSTLALANFEFLTPVFGQDTVRAVVFSDIGNVFDGIDEIRLDDMEASVGFGIRWRLRAFVRTDLRVDFARGLGDDGTTRVYAATRATF